MNQSLGHQLGTRCAPSLEPPRMSRPAVFTWLVQCHPVRDNTDLSKCGTTTTIAREPKLMRFKPLRRAQWSRTGNAAVWAFAFLPSGRESTQQTGECRRRTQRSDAAHDPGGAALCRDRSEQASKPITRVAHERAPGSTNAPFLTRSRPTMLFLRCRLAGNSLHIGSLGVRFVCASIRGEARPSTKGGKG